jgi:hypothetical protein
MILIYTVPLQPRRGDKSKGAKSGFRNFFAPGNEIEQFQCAAKSCFFNVKKRCDWKYLLTAGLSFITLKPKQRKICGSCLIYF